MSIGGRNNTRLPAKCGIREELKDVLINMAIAKIHVRRFYFQTYMYIHCFGPGE